MDSDTLQTTSPTSTKEPILLGYMMARKIPDRERITRATSSVPRGRILGIRPSINEYQMANTIMPNSPSTTLGVDPHFLAVTSNSSYTAIGEKKIKFPHQSFASVFP